MFLIQQTLVSGILMNQNSDWLALTESDYATAMMTIKPLSVVVSFFVPDLLHGVQ